MKRPLGPCKISSNSPLLGSTFEAHGVSRGQKSPWGSLLAWFCPQTSGPRVEKARGHGPRPRPPELGVLLRAWPHPATTQGADRALGDPGPSATQGPDDSPSLWPHAEQIAATSRAGRPHRPVVLAIATRPCPSTQAPAPAHGPPRPHGTAAPASSPGSCPTLTRAPIYSPRLLSPAAVPPPDQRAPQPDPRAREACRETLRMPALKQKERSP